VYLLFHSIELHTLLYSNIMTNHILLIHWLFSDIMKHVKLEKER